MKVFISWSGNVSHSVACVLRDWLPSVIQSVEPYVSSQDIDKGARWTSDISVELDGSNFGILCVTASNLDAPWLNFEAGALSKSFESARVAPFLFGINRAQITGPIVQFQSTLFEHEEVKKLIQSINAASEVPLDEHRLDAIFEVWWPKLEGALAAISLDIDGETATRGRNEPELLEEILELVRSQQRTLSNPAELLPPDYFDAMTRRPLSSHIPGELLIDIERALLLFNESASGFQERAFVDSDADFYKRARHLGELVEYLLAIHFREGPRRQGRRGYLGSE